MLFLSKARVALSAFSVLAIIAAALVHPKHILAGDEDTAVMSVRSGAWSDARTWDRGRLPSEGDRVEIAEGTAVLYDVASDTEIGGMVIKGTLHFSRQRDTQLDVRGIVVHPGGLLEIGTEDAPLPGSVRAVIRIVNDEDGENGIAVAGEVQIHGQPLKHVYTRLAQDAAPGSSQIVVQDEVDWKPGDHLVIASTTQRPGDSEERYVEAADGSVITLDRPLHNWHSGAAPTQAEVGNLTRNVVVTSKDSKLRGHTIFTHGARAAISYAEFSKLGPRKQKGKYPIHFHMAHDSMKDSYVRGAAIWDSNNRWITVHSTQHVTLSDNVGYRAVGHGFFMEEGDEAFVTWERNLGITVRPGRILPSDRKPAVFWVQNPVNTYMGNIAVGSLNGSGFEFKLPARKMDVPEMGENVKLRGLAVLRFEDNEAHSNAVSGLVTYVLNGAMSDEVSRIKGVKLWRNGKTGASIRGNRVSVEGASVFGNGEVNLIIRGRENAVVDSRVQGEVVASATPVTEDGPDFAPTPRGALFWGKENRMRGSVFEGHADASGPGTDVSFLQDVAGMSTLAIVDTRLKSERPVVLGYPASPGSFIRIKDYQQQPGMDMVLFRLDSQPPKPCSYLPDFAFVANVCR